MNYHKPTKATKLHIHDGFVCQRRAMCESSIITPAAKDISEEGNRRGTEKGYRSEHTSNLHLKSITGVSSKPDHPTLAPFLRPPQTFTIRAPLSKEIYKRHG